MKAEQITGMLLAGGRGSRMGGVDKGLQPLHGLPLASHVLQRLRPQVGAVMINANRNLDLYRAMDVPVWPDELQGYAGPLAGFLTGLQHCPTPWLLTVPCDTPHFPADLAKRLIAALDATGAEIAMARGPEPDGRGGVVLRKQPVFCLLPTALLGSLKAFTSAGGRKIDAWTGSHHTAYADFDRPGDDPLAFSNINTQAELQMLEAS